MCITYIYIQLRVGPVWSSLSELPSLPAVPRDFPFIPFGALVSHVIRPRGKGYCGLPTTTRCDYVDHLQAATTVIGLRASYRTTQKQHRSINTHSWHGHGIGSTSVQHRNPNSALFSVFMMQVKNPLYPL